MNSFIDDSAFCLGGTEACSLGLWETPACIHVIQRLSQPRVACWHGFRQNSQKRNACLHAVRQAVGKKIACLNGLRSEGVNELNLLTCWPQHMACEIAPSGVWLGLRVLYLFICFLVYYFSSGNRDVLVFTCSLGLQETLACIHVIPQMSQPRVACWHGYRQKLSKTECMLRHPPIGGWKQNCGFKRPLKQTG